LDTCRDHPESFGPKILRPICQLQHPESVGTPRIPESTSHRVTRGDNMAASTATPRRSKAAVLPADLRRLERGASRGSVRAARLRRQSSGPHTTAHACVPEPCGTDGNGDSHADRGRRSPGRRTDAHARTARPAACPRADRNPEPRQAPEATTRPATDHAPPTLRDEHHPTIKPKRTRGRREPVGGRKVSGAIASARGVAQSLPGTWCQYAIRRHRQIGWWRPVLAAEFCCEIARFQ